MASRPPPSIENGLRVDTIQMAFDAAIRGLGVALGRRPMVDDDIDSGRLVTLADREIPSGNGYWLVTSQAEFQKPEVKLFKRWLLSELAVASDESKQSPGDDAVTGTALSPGRQIRLNGSEKVARACPPCWRVTRACMRRRFLTPLSTRSVLPSAARRRGWVTSR